MKTTNALPVLILATTVYGTIVAGLLIALQPLIVRLS